ncbi:MAG: hypothetical protein HYT16_01135 [DPANN group archaeon]|nr:hypothetical protein [DPANN group archaeon]
MPPPSKTLDGVGVKPHAETGRPAQLGLPEILPKVVAENARLTAEKESLSRQLSEKSQALVLAEEGFRLQISDISGVDIYNKSSLLVHTTDWTGKKLSILAKCGDDGFSLFNYDLASKKEGSKLEYNLATLCYIFRTVAEHLLGPAAMEQEITIQASRFGSERGQLEQRLAQAESRAASALESEEQQKIANNKLAAEIANYEKMEQQFRDATAAQQKNLELEDLLNIVTNVELGKNGFFIKQKHDGRERILRVNDSGIYIETGDVPELLPETDRYYILFKIFGKHYTAFSRQEEIFLEQLEPIIKKETEILKAMGTKDSDADISKYERPIDATLDLLEKIQSKNTARMQARAKFMAGLHSHLEKIASDFGLSKDVVAAYNSKWGADSLAAVRYVFEEINKTALANSSSKYGIPDVLRLLVERVKPEFKGKMENLKVDDLLKLAVKSVDEVVRGKEKDIAAIRESSAELRSMIVAYISELSGSPVDISNLNDGTGSLRDLLNSAVKKKLTAWKLSALNEFYEMFPESYRAGLPENAELGAGMSRFAMDIERLASDAQAGRENAAALIAARENILRLEGDLRAASEKDRQLEARLAASPESEIRKMLESMLEEKDDMYKQIIAGKDALAKNAEERLAIMAREAETSAARLNEAGQQIADLNRQLAAEKIKKGTGKVVKKVREVTAAEKPADDGPKDVKIPDIELEETEQRPPAV